MRPSAPPAVAAVHRARTHSASVPLVTKAAAAETRAATADAVVVATEPAPTAVAAATRRAATRPQATAAVERPPDARVAIVPHDRPPHRPEPQRALSRAALRAAPTAHAVPARAACASEASSAAAPSVAAARVARAADPLRHTRCGLATPVASPHLFLCAADLASAGAVRRSDLVVRGCGESH